MTESSAAATDTPRNADIFLVKSVKDGIPNRNPDDGDARRLFADGRISVSDVSIKRDARDYVLARYPEGQDGRHVFFRQQRASNGALLGRKEMAQRVLADAGVEGAGEGVMVELIRSAWDLRTFGVVYSVGGENFRQTGPLQISWGHSLHPVESLFTRGTSSLPSQESTAAARSTRRRSSEPAPVFAGGSEADAEAPVRPPEELDVEELEEDTPSGEEVTGNRGGTFWDSYIVPFAVFLARGQINHTLCRQLGTTEADIELALEALWRGTQHRQGRGRGFQQPLMLVHVEYSDPHYRAGYLEDGVSLQPSGEQWLTDDAPSSVPEVSLDVTDLARTLADNGSKIARVRCWQDPKLPVSGAGELNAAGAEMLGPTDF